MFLLIHLIFYYNIDKYDLKLKGKFWMIASTISNHKVHIVIIKVIILLSSSFNEFNIIFSLIGSTMIFLLLIVLKQVFVRRVSADLQCNIGIYVLY